MEEKYWIDYASAIGSILTPILVTILTFFAWKYRKILERKIELEEKLRESRIDIYNSILEPFIIILMSSEAWKSDKKIKTKTKTKL